MRCIILAGGLGKRLRPLTNKIPKALLQVGGKPLLERTLLALPDEIKTVVIAVKHLGYQIKEHFGNKWAEKSIKYVDLTSIRGTMDALKQCKKWVKGKTLVLNGDDLYERDDIVRLIEASKEEPEGWFFLIRETTDSNNLGNVRVNSQGHVLEILEHKNALPQRVYANTHKIFVNAGAYILDERIFHYKPVRIPNGEFGLPQTMMQAKKEIPLRAVRSSFWMPLNTLEDYKRIQSVFSR